MEKGIGPRPFNWKIGFGVDGKESEQKFHATRVCVTALCFHVLRGTSLHVTSESLMNKLSTH